MSKQFIIPDTLSRYPVVAGEKLQAWDSADQLILDHLAEHETIDKRILIINDSFGALTLALHDENITSYSDSFVAHGGMIHNGANKKSLIESLSGLEGVYDFVLVKLPKNMSFFEDILCSLTEHLDPASQFICGGMIKHMAKSSFELLGKYIGETSTSLAVKKARLIFATFEKDRVSSPFPKSVKIEGFEHPFCHHSNLFSREKLDIGTRFFLENIPKRNYDSILDLGCANGIIGIKAKELNPNAKMVFSDESYMAIQSAVENYSKSYVGEAEFSWTNCFEDGEQEQFDLVLCNPPFHQITTIGDFIALQMFSDAKRILKKGGLLRVIGNSHLRYQHKLKKIFGSSKVIAVNKKFMVVDSYKR
ncbi:MAG: methyltransferase [Bacteriovoracaceae bacterium]|nr:methyltransferase [Bacteriovoracaceae bacterium]